MKDTKSIKRSAHDYDLKIIFIGLGDHKNVFRGKTITIILGGTRIFEKRNFIKQRVYGYNWFNYTEQLLTITII